jgi:hypothetical protein
MRWFRITRAEIKHETRELLEQYGPDTLRALLPGNAILETVKGARVTIDEVRRPILLWLKEQADREEKRETWLITMEVAITLFVGVELVISVVGLFHRCSM